MNRRRMMMQQMLTRVDLLAGNRYDTTSSYNVAVKWLDNNTIQVSHNSTSFTGNTNVGKGFIGSNKSSSSYVYCFNTTPMNNVELGKSYKLTLTVIEVTKNTATAENDGQLTLALGRQNHYGTIGTLNYSDIRVGAKIEAINTYKSSYNCIAGAAFNFNSPAIQWDFKCKVEFDEV